MPPNTPRENPWRATQGQPNQAFWDAIAREQLARAARTTNRVTTREVDVLLDEVAPVRVAEDLYAKPNMSNITVQNMYRLSPPEYVAKAIASHPGMQLFGIELEIEQFPVAEHEAKATGFVFKPDGSLRNNGIEAVSNPNTAIGTLNVTKQLWDKYNISDKNFSERTSIHVHCNVLDFNSEQFKNLVLLYCLFESILFDVVEESRKDNIFCVPWSQAGLHFGNYKRIWEQPANWQKYTALNLKTVASLGTVEFRHMHGHADFVLLSHWIKILEELMVFAKKSDSKEIYNRVLDLNTSSEYAKFLREVFPTQSDFLFEKSVDWQAHMIYGVIEAKIGTI